MSGGSHCKDGLMSQSVTDLGGCVKCETSVGLPASNFAGKVISTGQIDD